MQTQQSGTHVPSSAAAVLSVNIGRRTPSRYASDGGTGIDKRPVNEPIAVRAPGKRGKAGSGLAGDAVCDLRHHGGDDQAVYAYAWEDLQNWAADLEKDLTPGIFGENLTTTGIDITRSSPGERWAIGDTLVLEVSDPRIPCRTFAGHLDEKVWIKRFIDKGLPGTYLRVISPGQVRAGDTITVLSRPDHDVTVGIAFRALTGEPELLPLLVNAQGLSAAIRSIAARRSAGSPAAR